MELLNVIRNAGRHKNIKLVVRKGLFERWFPLTLNSSSYGHFFRRLSRSYGNWWICKKRSTILSLVFVNCGFIIRRLKKHRNKGGEKYRKENFMQNLSENIQGWISALMVPTVYCCQSNYCVLLPVQLLCIAASPNTVYCCQSKYCVLLPVQLLCIAASPTTVYCCQSKYCVLLPVKLLCIAASPTTVYCCQSNH
jgi:hypothetical protein